VQSKEVKTRCNLTATFKEGDGRKRAVLPVVVVVVMMMMTTTTTTTATTI
jgi:hypothetical protein